MIVEIQWKVAEERVVVAREGNCTKAGIVALSSASLLLLLFSLFFGLLSWRRSFFLK